jgi:hypothetical protein
LASRIFRLVNTKGMDSFDLTIRNDNCVVRLLPGGIIEELPFFFVADVLQGTLKTGDRLDNFPGFVEQLSFHHKQVSSVKQGDPSAMIKMSE